MEFQYSTANIMKYILNMFFSIFIDQSEKFPFSAEEFQHGY